MSPMICPADWTARSLLHLATCCGPLLDSRTLRDRRNSLLSGGHLRARDSRYPDAEASQHGLVEGLFRLAQNGGRRTPSVGPPIRARWQAGRAGILSVTPYCFG